jgi:glycosyltransferase involved in cell wall biosynthesis
MSKITLQIVPCIAEEASGPSYSVVRLSEDIMKLEGNIKLAVLDCGHLNKKIPFLIQYSRDFGLKRFGYSAAMKDGVVSMAKKDLIQLIHSHGLWMMPNIFPGEVSKKYDIPLVISPRGTMSKWAFQSGSVLIKKIVWNFGQKRCLENASLFHATAFSEYEDIRRLGFNQPVAVIPNGVDIPEMLEYSNNKNNRTLLFLGRIHPKKNVTMLLRAWGQLENQFLDWNLQITGPNNSKYYAEVTNLSKQLKLKRVVFTGELTGNDKWQAYQQAELFVLPTHSENFGMSVAESLASGTPVIVTKGAPWDELEVKDAGWWIDQGEKELVLTLYKALSKSKSDLNIMGKKGREWMKEDFAWSSIAKKMSESYRWLIDGGKKPEWIIEK